MASTDRRVVGTDRDRPTSAPERADARRPLDRAARTPKSTKMPPGDRLHRFEHELEADLRG